MSYFVTTCISILYTYLMMKKLCLSSGLYIHDSIQALQYVYCSTRQSFDIQCNLLSQYHLTICTLATTGTV